jgi:hypothetical protein
MVHFRVHAQYDFEDSHTRYGREREYHYPAIGRIHRLGQERVQDIYIITVDHSYDQILQAKAAKKMVAQLAGESRHEGTPEEKQASAEDLVTRILGQRCSRVEWADTDLGVKDQLKQAPFQL